MELKNIIPEQEVSLRSSRQQQQRQQCLAKKKSKFTSIESLINRINGQGRYQLVSFLLFGYMWFIVSWLLVGLSFFFDDSYECYNIDDRSKCHDFICASDANKRKQLIKSQADSIVFAFDDYLICENEYISTILQSMVFIGSLIGFFIIPYIADNWGRKPAIIISFGICTVGIAALSFGNSPTLIGVGYLLAGLGGNPAITLAYSFINEVGLGKTRQFYSVGIQLFFALGQCTTGLLFITSLHWYQINYIMLGLSISLNIALIYLVESPSFLLKSNKKKALVSFNKIAKINNRQELIETDLNFVASQQSSQVGAKMTDLFKFGSLRLKAIATGVLFFGIQTIYYSTSLNLGSAGPNKLINQEIIGLSEAAGYIVAEIIISSIPRKKLVTFGMGISSAMCIFQAIVQYIGNESTHSVMVVVELIALLINRLVLCCTWAITFVYLAQIFPTRVRSLGLGWVSAIGMIGSAVSPYMIFFSKEINISAWFLPGIIGVFSAVCGFFLPQTLGVPLKDQIEQLEKKQEKLQTRNSSVNSQKQANQDAKPIKQSLQNSNKHIKSEID